MIIAPMFKSKLFRAALLFVSFISSAVFIRAQNQFVSGSTGVDGAFSPTSNQTVQVPESGVFNFTTVTIPAGVTIKFNRNSQNTPITILATGNVTISGTIDISGQIGVFTNGVGGKGGPGGWSGGNGGINADSFAGMNGDGNGGGSGGNNNGTTAGAGGGGGFGVTGSNASGNPTAPYGQGGPAYGTYSMLPLFGGSGGGGGAATTSIRGAAAGGGGGGILIASSGTITLTTGSGSILAVGGAGQGATSPAGCGGGGSGGAVRLIANTISGNGTISVMGGAGGNCTVAGGAGGRGYIRAEAYDYSAFSPVTNSVPFFTSLPNPVSVPSTSTLQITSVADAAVPSATKGSLAAPPDIVLPGSLSNPIQIQIQATNVPANSVVQVVVTPPNGGRTTYQSTPLIASGAVLTASASINLPSGMSVITATLTVDLQVAHLQPMYINGEKIVRYEIASTLGVDSEMTFISADGKRLHLSALSQ